MLITLLHNPPYSWFLNRNYLKITCSFTYFTNCDKTFLLWRICSFHFFYDHIDIQTVLQPIHYPPLDTGDALQLRQFMTKKNKINKIYEPPTLSSQFESCQQQKQTQRPTQATITHKNRQHILQK